MYLKRFIDIFKPFSDQGKGMVRLTVLEGFLQILAGFA